MEYWTTLSLPILKWTLLMDRWCSLVTMWSNNLMWYTVWLIRKATSSIGWISIYVNLLWCMISVSLRTIVSFVICLWSSILLESLRISSFSILIILWAVDMECSKECVMTNKKYNGLIYPLIMFSIIWIVLKISRMVRMLSKYMPVIKKHSNLISDLKRNTQTEIYKKRHNW